MNELSLSLYQCGFLAARSKSVVTTQRYSPGMTNLDVLVYSGSQVVLRGSDSGSGAGFETLRPCGDQKKINVSNLHTGRPLTAIFLHLPLSAATGSLRCISAQQFLIVSTDRNVISSNYDYHSRR